jgi:hypothetical protein
MKNKLLFVMLIIALHARAQKSIVFYGNTQYQSQTFIAEPHYFQWISNYQVSNNLRIGLPGTSLAYRKVKNKRLFEVELGPISIEKKNISYAYIPNNDSSKLTSYNYKQNSQNYSLRMERGKVWLNGLVHKKNTSLIVSHSLNLNAKHIAIIPNYSSHFPATTSQVYLGYSIIPRINMDFGRRFTADINFPINLIQAGLVYNKVENPIVPVEQRNYSIFDFNISNRSGLVAARAGVAYKFN